MPVVFGYALLVALLVALGAWHGVIDRAGSAPVPERCGYRWTIPPQHVGEFPAALGVGVMKWLEQTLRGGEKQRVVSVYWSSAHLAAHIPGYRRTIEGVDTRVSASVHIHTRAKPDFYRDSPDSLLRQVFTRNGEMYGDYVVETNPHPPGYYRIVHPEHRRPRWWVSTIDPREYDGYVPARDWLVALCSWQGGLRPNTNRFVSCHFRPRIARDMTLSVRLSDENIHLREEVIAHMARKLREWVRVPEDDPLCFDDPFAGFPMGSDGGSVR